MPSWVEVDLNAVRENALRLREWVAPSRLIAVVKADAYGHGAEAIARSLEPIADRFAVATPEEALQLRKAGVQKPVLLLYPILPDQVELALRAGAEVSVAELSLVEALNRVGEQLQRTVSVQIEVETGMNRYGVAPERLPGLLERITERPALRLVGLWTHFACAEDPLNPFTWEQYDRFLRATGDGFPQAIRHVANSAAALNFPKLGLDAVRAGLALYGIYPGPNVRRAVPLRPALSWKATVLRVAELQAGEGVSYAPRFRTDRPRQIATLSVGYADGYRRTAMGRSWVLIQGRRAPVVGTVCMDAVVCDITEIPGVRPGTVATLLGSDGKEALTAEELARQWGTIPYEVLTGIGPRVQRRYLGEETTQEDDSTRDRSGRR